MRENVTKRFFLLWYLNLQVFGTTELPDKPIMLPPFVDSTHCLPYYLTRKGRAVADRVVSVLAYVCPDITYSPTIYPIAAILLHFMSGMWNSIRCKIEIAFDFFYWTFVLCSPLNHFRGRMLPLFSQFSGCQREGVHYTNEIAGTKFFWTNFYICL